MFQKVKSYTIDQSQPSADFQDWFDDADDGAGSSTNDIEQTKFSANQQPEFKSDNFIIQFRQPFSQEIAIVPPSASLGINNYSHNDKISKKLIDSSTQTTKTTSRLSNDFYSKESSLPDGKETKCEACLVPS